MECALELGVSQKVLENEYYMIDLPLLLYKKQKQDAALRLLDLQIAIAPHMEEKDYRRFVEHLTKMLEDDDNPDELDKEGLEMLKRKIHKT